jgi:hypothetical protein
MSTFGFKTEICPMCNMNVNMFAYIERKESSIEAMRQLAEGCKKHPGYRYKKKPTAKCKECQRLWELAETLRSYEHWTKVHTEARLRADTKKREEEWAAYEAYYNSHQ